MNKETIVKSTVLKFWKIRITEKFLGILIGEQNVNVINYDIVKWII